MKKVSGSSPTLKLFQTQPLLVDLRQSFFHFLMESGVTVSQEIPSAVRDDSLKEAYWRIDVLHRHLILWTVTGLEVLNANESLVSVETSPQDWKCGSVISFWCCFEILSYSYPHYIKLSSWPFPLHRSEPRSYSISGVYWFSVSVARGCLTLNWSLLYSLHPWTLRGSQLCTLCASSSSRSDFLYKILLWCYFFDSIRYWSPSGDLVIWSHFFLRGFCLGFHDADDVTIYRVRTFRFHSSPSHHLTSLIC